MVDVILMYIFDFFSVKDVDRSSVVVLADVTVRMYVGQQRGMESSVCLRSNAILVLTLNRCMAEVWLMYGTAKVENRKRTFRKGNEQRNRAIKRLSTTTPYISSGSNALTIAGGLAQYYQIQYVVAAQNLAAQNSVDVRNRKACLTQTHASKA